MVLIMVLTEVFVNA